MQINKVSGFNTNSYNLTFGEKMRKAETIYSNPVVELEKALELTRKMDKVSYLFDNGVPNKAVFAYDDELTFATVRFYDKKENCIMTSDVLDEDVEACTELLLRKGVKPENILYWDIIKGEKDITPPKKYLAPGESAYLSEFGKKEQAAVKKILINSYKRDREPVVLSSNVTFNDDEKKYKMSYGEFLARTYGSRFDISKVLDSLNASTANAFKTNDIEHIIVTPDGTMMEIRAKDGSRAFMDFNTGKRRAFDGNADSHGFGTLLLMDNYGPVIRKTKTQEANEHRSRERSTRKKAVNENESIASNILRRLGIGRSKGGIHYRA